MLDQAMELADQSIAEYKTVLESAQGTTTSLIPLDDVARLGLGNSLRLKGQITHFKGDASNAMPLFDQSIELIDQTVRPLKDASQLRYLTQAYEYLGEAYRWKGFVQEAGQDYPRALEAYQQSVGYYNQCIAMADGSQDLIIRNEIVRDICTPNHNEVQAIIDDLSGGQ